MNPQFPDIEGTSTRVVGIIVTYFPSEDFEGRLACIANFVDDLVVVDNSADPDVSKRLQCAKSSLGVALISNDKNLGIATALNQGVAFAVERGGHWALFFDQDTSPSPELRQELVRISRVYRGARPLGIIAAKYTRAGTQAAPNPPPSTLPYVTMSAVITSGSAYSVEMLTRLGKFKDAYFIDLVDVEYCWRAIVNGYAVIQTVRPLMTHGLGAPAVYNVLGQKVSTFDHAAFRHYFIGRNFVFLLSEYFRHLPVHSVRLAVSYGRHLLLAYIFGRQRSKKLRNFGRGLWHGLTNQIAEQPWLLVK